MTLICEVSLLHNKNSSQICIITFVNKINSNSQFFTSHRFIRLTIKFLIFIFLMFVVQYFNQNQVKTKVLCNNFTVTFIIISKPYSGLFSLNIYVKENKCINLLSLIVEILPFSDLQRKKDGEGGQEDGKTGGRGRQIHVSSIDRIRCGELSTYLVVNK